MKRLLSAAMVACLLMNPTFARAEGDAAPVQIEETATPAPSDTPAPVSEEETTPEPVAEPAATLTAEPSEVPAAEATAETTPESEAETDDEPEASPTAEVSEEPSPEASDAPSPEASPETSPDVSVAPSPEVSPDASDAPSPETSPETSPEAGVSPSPEVSPDASVAPSPETSPETSPEASVSPSPEESVTPAPEESLTPSPDTSATPSPEESVSPSPEVSVSPMPEIPEEAEAWMIVEEQLVYGTLAEMIAASVGEMEIVLHIETPMFIEDAPLKRLSELTLLLDEEIFDDETMEYRIAYSTESPEDVEEPAELDPEEFKDLEEDVVADLYIWVVQTPKTPDVTEDPTAEPTEEPEATAEIVVEVTDYAAAQWSQIHPTFTLSGIPEDKTDWAYAVIIYDERIAILSENTYCAEAEGVYTVRFAILDESGDIVSASERYTLWLDHTLPQVYASTDEVQSYTLHVMATDSMSGVQALTLDGGATWIDMQNDVPYTYVATGKTVLASGMVQVRDAAGNVWISPENYSLDKVVVYSGGGYGGGGGGGSSTPAKQHAAAESTEKTAEYDALLMELPEEPMNLLTIDGEELALTLELTNAEDFEIPEDHQATFTAELAAWTPTPPAEGEEEETEPSDEEEEPAPDTLILTAVMEENLGDRFEYRWKFNGEVYRILANSDIRYLALQVGEDMLVFPTEGFVGGTKYTELKMLGVATKKFDYTVAMNFNLDPDRIPMLSETDFSENCDVAIQAEVENMKYVLSAEQKGEMYYYNVYLGPQSMLEKPYGQFAPVEELTDTVDHD